MCENDLDRLIGMRNAFIQAELNCSMKRLPLSFRMDEAEIDGLFEDWEFISGWKGNCFEFIAHHAETGLKVTCSGKRYDDFPVVEWTFRLKNESDCDTPLLKHIQAADLRFDRAGGDAFTIRTNRGDTCTAAAYQPLEMKIGYGDTQRFAPVGGRPTNMAYPFFNLAWDGCGVLMAIGWPGQWEAKFYGDRPRSIRFTAGQEMTRLRLCPGEEIRTPLIALMFRGEDFTDSQNLWRRWMVRHNMPRINDHPIEPFSSTSYGLVLTAEIEMAATEYLHENGVTPDYLWTDAGWYRGCEFHSDRGRDWTLTGTWESDKARYPQTYHAVSDHAGMHGMKSLLWFESERVSPGTELAQHDDWLLRLANDQKVFRPSMDWEYKYEEGRFSTLEAYRNQIHNGDMLLNLGNDEAREYITELTAKRIEEYNLACYRTDFNINPLEFWRAADEKERQGITEIRYVEGFLKFLDELHRRFPHLIFDTCASGGRRTDLETLRRAAPLTRSDFIAHSKSATGNQGQTYGMSMWVPYGGTGAFYGDAYILRSHLCPFMQISCAFNLKDIRATNVDWKLWRKSLEDWKAVRLYYLGDYYPLTEYSISEEKWIAWQFHRPDLGGGVVQAFRRTKCKNPSAVFKLYGMDAVAIYQIRNLDEKEVVELTGRELMEEGLEVLLSEPCSAVIMVYQKLADS